jgi:sugar phosphate isomerase/epimerase
MGVGAALLPSHIMSQSTQTKERSDNMRLGIASYTFRKFSLEDTLAMTNQLGIDWIALKSFHLPMESTKKQIKEVAAQVKSAGINLYGAGVIYMKDAAEVNRAFEYARTANMKVIIGVPDHHLLQLVESKVKEYDIKVAIHNHGPGDKKYPTPESIMTKIEKLDPRIGICIDIGHVKRLDLDPAENILKFGDRILDVHLKDVNKASKEGGSCEMGRGVIDIPDVLQALKKIKYTDILAFEYEKDAENPLPGLAETVGYARGVLDVI